MRLLAGVKIVSFNHYLMGPLAMQHLADMGATVIAVEPVGGAFQRKWGGANCDVDGQTMLFLASNRNKKSIALDLKSAEGVDIAKRLVSDADVVSENFRPGVMEKLGLGYDDLKRVKPDLIYASATGYGSDGPSANEPGQDLIVQAMSGLLTITGTAEDGPRPVGASVVDHHGASLLAMGILAALLKRERSGEGGRLEVSLLDAAIDLQLESFTCYLNSPVKPNVVPNRAQAGWYFPAPYGVYAATDGHIVISLGRLEPIYEALDVPAGERIPSDEAYERRDDVLAVVAASVRRQSVDAVAAALREKGVWHSRVNDYDSVVGLPQVGHLNKFRTVPGATGSDICLVGHPIRFDGAAPDIDMPPQPLGAQTRELLATIGYSDAEIARLRDEQVVA